jgi:MFS family permease
LVRSNASFRWLWIGTVVSLLGDWFNTIAIYELVNELTGSPLALGAVFITKMLPFALVSPLAGLIADRIDRRDLMIGSDLVRAVVVLGFLLVDDVGDLPLLYILTALQVALSATFLPARSASIPNITTADELLTANTLMSATWSIMLALGAALGGFATEWMGIRAVFLIDSASYLFSAGFIFLTVIPHHTAERAPGSLVRSAYEDIVSGWKHLVSHPEVGRIAPAKAVWSVGGGALVYMLALLGERINPEASAVGIGVLFAARGIGTGVGPVLARAWFTNESKWPLVLGACIITSGVFYLTVGFVSWTSWVALLVVISHAASGANWVLASVLLQRRTIDHFRGRVFGTEWLFVTLADALSILAASLMLEAAWVDLRAGFQVFAVIQIISGIFWIVTIVPREREGGGEE